MFAPNAESFIASPTYVDRWLLSRMTDAPLLQNAKAVLFPGYLTYLFAVVGVATLHWRSPRQPSTATSGWTRLAWLVEVVLVGFLALAIAVTITGAVRIRYRSMLLLSARQPWRLWLECAALVGVRGRSCRRAPIDAAGRIRRISRRFRERSDTLRRDPRIYYLVLALITFWLALGPGYGLYNRVYGWPGFSFIRVPSRFTIVTLLALAVLAGSGFEWWTNRFSPIMRRRLATVVTAILLVAEFSAFPLGTILYSFRPTGD